MIYVITGPTNTGKDHIAIELAKRLGGEIINADAFHVYRQLQIGTNKPKEEDFGGIKHHLFAYIDVDHNYSIAQYQHDARAIIDDLLRRNIPIIMLGGSGLYLKAALYDYRFQTEEPVDMELFNAFDNQALHEHLVAVDPASARLIHPNNRKRTLRALQIYYAQGVRKSTIPLQKDEPTIYDCRFYGITFNRDELYQRISVRVQRMVDEGLFQEVKQLVDKYGYQRQAFSAIGYKEVIAFLLGKTNQTDAIEAIATNTRHYVKRQMTYVRHQFPMTWITSVDDIIRSLENGKTT